MRPTAITVDPMDWVRAALLNAKVENLTIADLIAMAEHAKTPRAFDAAVNEFIRTMKG